MSHFAVQQKLTQHCKSTILQLKTKLKKKKRQNILQFFSNPTVPHLLPFRVKAKVLVTCTRHCSIQPLFREFISYSSAPGLFYSIHSGLPHIREASSSGHLHWLFILPGTLLPETTTLSPPPVRQAAKSPFPGKSSGSSLHKVCPFAAAVVGAWDL